MDTVITRIIEIEKKSALDIERAEEACHKNIEARRRALEEEKERAHAFIVAKENSRLTEAIQALIKQTGEAALTAGKDYESMLHDPAKIAAIKEKIAAILLAE